MITPGRLFSATTTLRRGFQASSSGVHSPLLWADYWVVDDQQGVGRISISVTAVVFRQAKRTRERDMSVFNSNAQTKETTVGKDSSSQQKSIRIRGLQPSDKAARKTRLRVALSGSSGTLEITDGPCQSSVPSKEG